MNIANKKSLGRTIVIALVILIVVITAISFFPTFADAQGKGIEGIKEGIGRVAGDTGLTSGGSVKTTDDVLGVVGKVINVLLSFLGAAFLILVLYAGGMWMFAMGDAGKVKKAKGIIKTASIGLAVIVLSFAIVSLVLDVLGKATGTGSGGGGSGCKGTAEVCGSSPECCQTPIPRVCVDNGTGTKTCVPL